MSIALFKLLINQIVGWKGEGTAVLATKLRATRPADVLKNLEAARINFPLRYRLLYCAVRLVGVVAIVKAALAEVGGKFNKALFNFPETQVMQAKHYHARTINQVAVRV